MATIEVTGAEEVAWDLSDLYAGADDPALEQDVSETEAAAAAFRERYRGKVAELDARRARRGDRRARAHRRGLHPRRVLRAPQLLRPTWPTRRAARSSPG